MLHRKIIAICLVGALPAQAAAQCRIAVIGTACVRVPDRQKTAERPLPAKIGETLARGQYSLLMNADYYGLPPVQDGWVYMRIEDKIFRVDWESHVVLEHVTDRAGRNW